MHHDSRRRKDAGGSGTFVGATVARRADGCGDLGRALDPRNVPADPDRLSDQSASQAASTYASIAIGPSTSSATIAHRRTNNGSQPPLRAMPAHTPSSLALAVSGA